MNYRPLLVSSFVTMFILSVGACNKPRASSVSSGQLKSGNCMELEGSKTKSLLLLDGEKIERKQADDCVNLNDKIFGGDVMALVVLASQLYSVNAGSAVALQLESFLTDLSIENLQSRYEALAASSSSHRVTDIQLQSLHAIELQTYAQKISPRFLLAILSKSGVKKANSRSASGAKGILLLANKVFIGADQLSEKNSTFEWSDDESILAHELIAELRASLNQHPKARKKIILDSRIVIPGRSIN